MCHCLVLIRDVIVCGRGHKSGLHPQAYYSMFGLIVMQSGSASALMDFSPHKACRGTLVGFCTYTADDKSFAPVSVSFTSVLTHDKQRNAGPALFLHQLRIQNNSNIKNPQHCLLLCFSQSSNEALKASVIR